MSLFPQLVYPCEAVRERLTRSDIRFLLVCLLILGVTVWFSARFFYRAFPEASIDFAVTREQARDLARQFLDSQGHRLDGYREASRFSFDNNAKTFLEREVGLDQANQIMGRRVRLWRWSYRWFRPLQKEEFRVDITPAGQMIGFQHLIPETAAGARLPPQRARSLAEDFLRQSMQRDPGALEFVESRSVDRPARTDQVFTWKERDFSVREATYRLEVTVTGDRIGGYREYLKIPETWLRDYERLRSRNDVAQAVDSAATLLLAVGALVILLKRVGRRDVRWGRAAAFGGVGAVLIFLASWNAHPLAEFRYPTTDSYGSFLASQLLQNLLSALGGGALLFGLTAAAEPLYRESFGSRVSLGQLFRWRGLRTKSFFLGSVLGVALTGCFVAYQIAFYLLAYRFGAWSPADVPYDDLLNTRFPWLFVLLGGFLPAVSEEFLFRMFSIPFLHRLFRSTGVALILAGFLWGFGHSAYPQQPFFIRGVEVGIGGVALGLVMLRWGILPTLVWHYSVDALYTALLLLRSHNPYFILSGAASAGIVLLPLLAVWVAYLRGKGFQPETGLTNQEEGSAVAALEPEAPSAQEVEQAYQPWSARRRAVALGMVVALVGFLLIPSKRVRGTEFAVTAAKARSEADAFLRQRGPDPAAYRSVVYVEEEFSRPSSCCGPGRREIGKYFLERRPPGYLKDFCWRLVPLHSWNVRYYRPLEKEEIRISLHPETGKVIGFEHSLPEDQPGADLPPESAQQIAASYLAGRGFDLNNFELKETTSEKRKARRDHMLVWEAKSGDPINLDEARYRVRVQVAGDRVTGLRTLWKLPEAFVRERARRNALATGLFVMRGLVIIAGVGVTVAVLFLSTRQRQLRWRPAAAVAALVAGLGALGSLFEFPLIFRDYDTAISLNAFHTQAAVFLVMGLIGGFLVSICAAGLLLAVRPDAGMTWNAHNRRRLGRDALLAAVLGVAVAGSVGQVRRIVLDRFHEHALLLVEPPSSFALAVPAGPDIASAPAQALVRVALLALVVYVAQRLRRRWLVVLVGLAAVAGLMPAQIHTPGEFALYYGMATLSVTVLIAYCRWFAQNNYLAYVLAIWSWILGSQALELLSQPATALQQQGGLVAAVLVVTVLWAVLPAFRAGKIEEKNPMVAGPPD